MQEQTQGQTGGDQVRINETCANCGMTREDWRGNGGQGYSLGGILYCCEGCAKGDGCSCTQ